VNSDERPNNSSSSSGNSNGNYIVGTYTNLLGRSSSHGGNSSNSNIYIYITTPLDGILSWATLPGSSSRSKVEAGGNLKFTIASWYQVASTAAWCLISERLVIHLGKGDGQIEVGVRQE
jgi:hypothetical protein